MASDKRPVPREHGAWGLLLQPFVAAAVLAGPFDWLLIPALLLVLFGFLIREPLIVLARERWAGHRRTELWRSARQWLVIECLGAAVCFLILARHVSLLPLAVLMGIGLAVTVVSVWFSVRNRQRSTGLQILAVAGLGSSAFLAALASTGGIPLWSWWLWAILSMHGIVSVLCVHARLNIRISAKDASRSDPLWAAAWAILGELAIAIPVALYGGIRLAIPIVFSVVVSALELWRLRTPAHVREPLRRVGFRMLGTSIAHMVITIIALWTSRFSAP